MCFCTRFLLQANVLTIAGVDPSGGAGVLADLKAFSALGAYGCGAIAALTAQNTRAVTGIHEVPPEFLKLQLDTRFHDVRIDAVKIGMLASRALIGVVAEALRRYAPAFVVLDPVMVANSGDRLLRAEAVDGHKRDLLPLAAVLTPNLPETGDLLGHVLADSPEAMRDAARALHALGPKHVLVKGGHGSGDTLVDVLFDGSRIVEQPALRHGEGAAKAISSELSQAHRESQLGWKVQVSGVGRTDAERVVRGRLKDRTSLPVDRIEAELRLLRPGAAQPEINLPLGALDPGVYGGVLNLPASGRWVAELRLLSDRAVQYQMTHELVAP